MKKFLSLLLLGTVLVVVTGCSVQETTGVDQPVIKQPEIKQDTPTEPSVDTDGETVKEAVPQSDPGLSFLSLPDGYSISSYADVPNARSMNVVETDTQRIVFVGNRAQSSVYAVIDENKDGQAEEVKEIASGLNSPNGVAFKDGDLYVAEISRILVFRDILTSLDNASYEVVYDDLPTDPSHGWKYIAFGPDGRLYIPIGAPCNNCDAGLPYSTLYALDLETKERELIAQGIRNTVGFDRHPETEELWFTDNGRDRMGDDIPADELNRLTTVEGHYGYPFCHGGDVEDDTFTSRNCDEFIPPFAKLGPHVAALGMTFSDEATVSDEWKNHILIAEHGSWNRTTPIGYRISAVDLETNGYKIFIDGWLEPDKVSGRPVDIVGLDDGSLLISDDFANKLYRVVYTLPIEIEEVVVDTPPKEWSVEALIEEEFVGTDLVFEEQLAQTNAYTRYRISYQSNGIEISGIMNIPVGSGPFPLVILNHGYIDPAVYTVGRGLKREQDFLARNGYAVLHTDYRNHGLSDQDQSVKDNYFFRSYFYSMDSINAINAVKALNDERFDTTKVAMLGHSMGGGVTMHAMIARPELLSAAVLYAPVHSQEFDNAQRRRYEDMSQQEKDAWSERLGDLTLPETFAEYSAANYIERVQTPVQIYHGTNDESVPYNRSVETVATFEEAGKEIELITYAGEKHEFVPQRNNFMNGVVAFFDEEL